MRRLQVKPITVKPITIQVHPNLYAKMEEIRKQFKNNNINLSQVELTNMIATKVKVPKIDLLGVNKNGIIKKR